MTQARRRRILEDVYGPDVKDPVTGGLPWSGDPRGRDKTRIWRHLLNLPAGAPISGIVENLWGVSVDDEESEYQRHYRFTKRFVEEAPIFRIDRGQQLLHVEPRPAAFHLTSPKHCSNTDAVRRSGNIDEPAGESSGIQSAHEERARGGSESVDSPTIEQTPEEISVDEYPKEFARNFLDSRGCKLLTPSRQRVIESQFASYLEQIDGRYNILKNIEDEHPEYLLVPYKTLYNDKSRVDDNWRRYHAAWKKGTKQYSKGVQLTLTTDPKQFNSIQEMIDKIGKNFNRFMSWLRRRLADRCDDLGTEGHNLRDCPDCEEFGERPDYIKCLEWTEKGRPHLHIIFFGIDKIADQPVIAEEWGKYQAPVLDVRQVHRKPVRNGDGISVDGHELAWMSTGDEKTDSKNEKAHMGKYLAEQMPSQQSTEEIRARVEDEDDDLWKTALFWASGKQFWSCSENLKPDSDEEEEKGLADLPQYIHVGAAKAGDIPKHVWETSVKLLTGGSRGKDPPDDHG